MFKKVISLVLSVVFSLQTCGFAQVGQLNLSGYLGQGGGAPALDRFRPAHLRYFSYEPDSDNFQILLDKADEKDLSDIQVKDKADELMRYFRIGLSLPNEKFWVNLRPDAPEQIIDPELERTDIGKIMLEADLQLKKDTASFTSPQTKEGKEYWDKLYKKAGELFGTENITIPTITRPWIVPGEIIVRESGDSAYIYKAALKVMLEEDYLTSRGGSRTAPTYQQYAFSDPRLKELNQYSTQLIRELIIPQLTKEVNRAKRYAGLRQVFYSLVLSRWFKQSYQNSGAQEHQGTRAPVNEKNTLTKLIDSGSLANLTSQEPWNKDTYYQGYKKSFEQGEYNLSETVHTPTGQVIRRYISGGTEFTSSALTVKDHFGIGNVNRSIPSGGNGVFLDGNSIAIATGSPLVQNSQLSGKLYGWDIFDSIEKLVGSGGKTGIYFDTNVLIGGMVCTIIKAEPRMYDEGPRRVRYWKIKFLKDNQAKEPAVQINVYRNGDFSAETPETSNSVEEDKVVAKVLSHFFRDKPQTDALFKKWLTRIIEDIKLVSGDEKTRLQLSDLQSNDFKNEISQAKGPVLLKELVMKARRTIENIRKDTSYRETKDSLIKKEKEISALIKFLNVEILSLAADKITKEFERGESDYNRLLNQIVTRDEHTLSITIENLKVGKVVYGEDVEVVNTINTNNEELTRIDVYCDSINYPHIIQTEFRKGNVNARIVLAEEDGVDAQERVIKALSNANSADWSGFMKTIEQALIALSIVPTFSRTVKKMANGFYELAIKDDVRLGEIGVFYKGTSIPAARKPSDRYSDFENNLYLLCNKISENKDSRNWEVIIKKGSSVEEIEKILLSEVGASSALTLEILSERLNELIRRTGKFDITYKNFPYDFDSLINKSSRFNNFSNQWDLAREYRAGIWDICKAIKAKISSDLPDQTKQSLQELLAKFQRLDKYLSIAIDVTAMHFTETEISAFLVSGLAKAVYDAQGEAWMAVVLPRDISMTGFYKEVLIQPNFDEYNRMKGYMVRLGKLYYEERYLKIAMPPAAIINFPYNGLISFSLESDFEEYLIADANEETFEKELLKIRGLLLSSSALMNVSDNKRLGAVDFRSMNMLIQPMGSFAGLDFSPVRLSSSALEAMDLDKGLENIKQMASSSMLPSPQRLKEYISACIFKGKIDEKGDDFILSMLEVFQLQAEEGIESAALEREAVVMADTRSYVLPEKRLAVSNSYNLN